jgi:hypothetical protein
MANQNDILKALEVIQSVCKEREDCTTCPFRDDDSAMPACLIQGTPPAEWKIKGQEKSWRAFQ